MITNEDYQKARVNLAVRQDFLDRMLTENATEIGQYVPRILYANKGNPIQDMILGKQVMVTCMGKRFALPATRIGTITVYSAAFDIERLPTFESFLIDHEGQHAKDAHLNPGRYDSAGLGSAIAYLVGKSNNVEDKIRIRAEAEYKAYKSQVDNAKRRGLEINTKLALFGLMTKWERVLKDGPSALDNLAT